MLTKARYSVRDMILWTRLEVALFLLFPFGLLALGELADLHLRLPWAPVAVLGTAVAFIVGFQNNAAYGRIWEARKIWGGIVNTSRTWAMKVSDMVTNEYAKEPASEEELTEQRKVLVHRHVAWLTALRYAMRQPRPWEQFEEHKTNREWSREVCIPERRNELTDELVGYLSDEERAEVLSKKNKAAAVLFLQSRHLRSLKERGLIWEFSFLELENLLQELFTLQGKSERIKNFPYPRQYATLSYHFVWVFLLLFPFAAIPEFVSIAQSLSADSPTLGRYFMWAAVPFCALVSWVFHTMERIGRVGENPFEGSANDVPISTIARGIEIDLRQLIDEAPEAIPEQFPALYNVQM